MIRKSLREAQENARKEAEDQLKGGTNPENKSKDIVDNQQKNAKDKLNDKEVEYNGKSVKQNNDLFDPRYNISPVLKSDYFRDLSKINSNGFFVKTITGGKK